MDNSLPHASPRSGGGPYPGLGLLITGGEGPDDVSLRLLASWASRVVAADSGWDTACRAGIRVDRVVGDMDSVQSSLASAPDVRTARRDKAESDTQLGLAALRELGATDIILAGGGGGRMDHLLAIRDLLAHDKETRRWYTSHDEVLCIRNSFRMPTIPGMTMSIFPLGTRCRLGTSGLRWPLDSLVLGPGIHSLSNESTGTEVVLVPQEGEALLVRTLRPGQPLAWLEGQTI